MDVNADGSPVAYNPTNTGLDDIANAKDGGKYVGIVMRNGRPVTQGINDPAPGYYVSPTALQDVSKMESDPARYLDAQKYSNIVLPKKQTLPQSAINIGANLGDPAVVINPENGKISLGVYGEVGPERKLGEASIKTARDLGVDSNPRHGGSEKMMKYIIFPGMGNGFPRSQKDVERAAEMEYQIWRANQQNSP